MDDTNISLKEYVEKRFELMRQGMITTAGQLDKRLDSMNEFRAQIQDMTAKLASRIELEDKLKTQDVKLETLESKSNINSNRISNMEGRAYAIGLVITVISIGVSIWLHFAH